MERLKILEKKEKLSWEYDDGADVLYISVREPKPAESLDIGEGTIVRLDPKTKEVVGFTILGLSKRILRELK